MVNSPLCAKTPTHKLLTVTDVDRFVKAVKVKDEPKEETTNTETTKMPRTPLRFANSFVSHYFRQHSVGRQQHRPAGADRRHQCTAKFRTKEKRVNPVLAALPRMSVSTAGIFFFLSHTFARVGKNGYSPTPVGTTC